MISGTRYRLSVEINRQSAMAADIARIQTEISTGKRIQAPSDDPTAAARVAQIARAHGDETAWLANLGSAASLAERSDTVLQSVSDRVDRASELLLSAASGTLSPENRAIVAAELRGISQEVAALAQSPDQRGQPLFRVGAPLEIPVHSGGTIVPVQSRDAIFGNVATAAGARDLQTIISDAADAVLEPDDALRSAAIGAAVDAVNAAATHVAAARGAQGVTAHRIDDLKERLTQSGVQLDEERAGLESTDMVDAITRLQSRELGLQAAQAVFTRINQGTLFDLLR